jgi:hypothetical protein
MTWLRELIVTAGEENWCVSTRCGYSECGICRYRGVNQGFRLFLRVLSREQVIDDLRTLPREICDRYPYILRTVFADVSRYGSVDAGSDLLEPLENTPAGAVLKAAIHHARQRYDIWRADRHFCSPEAAKARAEARKHRIVKEQSLRNERRTKLDKELLIFREAIDQADFDRFFSELLGVEDPVVARAVGGIAYSVLCERLRSEELSKAELELLQRSALIHGGHWAKLLKMKLCVTRS